MPRVIIVISSDNCFLEMVSLGLTDNDLRVKDFENPLRALKWIEKNSDSVVAIISHALIQNITLEEFITKISEIKADIPALLIDDLGIKSFHENRLKSIAAIDPVWVEGPVELRQLTDFIMDLTPGPDSLTDNIESISMF